MRDAHREEVCSFQPEGRIYFARESVQHIDIKRGEKQYDVKKLNPFAFVTQQGYQHSFEGV